MSALASRVPRIDVNPEENAHVLDVSTLRNRRAERSTVLSLLQPAPSQSADLLSLPTTMRKKPDPPNSQSLGSQSGRVSEPRSAGPRILEQHRENSAFRF